MTRRLSRAVLRCRSPAQLLLLARALSGAAGKRVIRASLPSLVSAALWAERIAFRVGCISLRARLLHLRFRMDAASISFYHLLSLARAMARAQAERECLFYSGLSVRALLLTFASSLFLVYQSYVAKLHVQEEEVPYSSNTAHSTVYCSASFACSSAV